MRWLINVYDFRFKWKAAAGIEIHHTKAWLSLLVNFVDAIWTLEGRYAVKFCLKLTKNAMWWKLDLLLWPAGTKRQSSQWKHAGSARPKKARQRKIHPQTFDDPFYWQHWYDLHALGSHWTNCQQGILCWGFKGHQEEISFGIDQHSSNRLCGISTRTSHQSTTPS